MNILCTAKNADIAILAGVYRLYFGVTLIMIANLGEKNKMLQNIFHNKIKIMYNKRPRVRKTTGVPPLPILGAVAGVLNGFLGTGGGMVLAIGLRKAYPGQEKECMAISTASMMFLSFLSTILYSIGGHIGAKDVFPVILPALIGGALGSLVLGRIRHELFEILLGGMLLYSGLALLL